MLGCCPGEDGRDDADDRQPKLVARDTCDPQGKADQRDGMGGSWMGITQCPQRARAAKWQWSASSKEAQPIGVGRRHPPVARVIAQAIENLLFLRMGGT